MKKETKSQRTEGIFMRLRAMAKINLGLDILGKRDDGYHEVRMLMQTIQMYDLLDIRRKSSPGITLTTNLLYVPSDERNLVYKAAKLLMDEFDIQEGISMKLTSRYGRRKFRCSGSVCRCKQDVSSWLK